MPRAPEVRGVPLLGNALGFWRDPVAFFRQSYERYGPVFTFRLAHRRGAALVGPELQRFFFQQTDDLFSLEEAYRFLESLFGEGLLFLAPEAEQREQKAVYHPAFKGARLSGYLGAMVREVDEWLEGLGDSGELEVTKAFRHLATSVAARALLGEAFRQRLGPAFVEQFRFLMEGIDYILPPNLPLPRFRRRERAKVELNRMLHAIITERRASDEPADDFLQTLVDAHYSDGRPFGDRLIADLVLSLLWSGYETSAGTLAWLLLNVLRHPEVAARLAEERERLVDPERPLDMETLVQMRYLEMVLRETERFTPVIPLLMRQPLRDYEAGGFTIPRGTLTFVCPPVAHHLPEVFLHPERFDPERFAPEKLAGYPPFSLIGFGGAHHRCLGFNFASYELKIVLTSLLGRFEVELVTPDPRPLTRPGTVRGPVPPCVVRYRRKRGRRVVGSRLESPTGGAQRPG